MENVKILIDGIEKSVYGLFYIFESKYYFIYTEKEIDENNYVILYMTQVGKETKSTETGIIDTGNMIGIEITDPEEQQKIKNSISYIVEDKKNNTTNPQIQYLPITMLSNLKIVSKKRFRLLKSIMEDNFKLEFVNQNTSTSDNLQVVEPVVVPLIPEEPQPQPIQIVQPVPVNGIVEQSIQPVQPVMPDQITQQPVSSQEMVDVQTQNIPVPITQLPQQQQQIEQTTTDLSPMPENVIIDYRTKYFEEEAKNKELQAQIEMLNKKLEEIKKVIE